MSKEKPAKKAKREKVVYRKVDDLTDITYFTKIANAHPPLSQSSERELIMAVQDYPETEESRKAMEKLIKFNYRWVIKTAKVYQNKGLTFQDLIEEGLIGLFVGIMKFDPDRRYKGQPLKLGTYVTCWIRQAITRAIAKTGRMIRIPINVCADYTKVQILYGKFTSSDLQPGRRPNADELAILYAQARDKEIEEWLALPPDKRKGKEVKLKPKTPEQISELGRFFLPVDSLDVPHSEDENLTLLDYLCEEEDRQPEVLSESTQNNELLISLMSILTVDERKIMELLYGLIDGKQRDKKSVAAIMKTTIENVKQTEIACLNKMRFHADTLSIGNTPNV